MSNETGTGNTIISTVGWTLLVALLTTVINYQADISAWLLAISPDWLDPIVGKAWTAILALIMLFVGPNQQKSTVESAYKKVS